MTSRGPFTVVPRQDAPGGAARGRGNPVPAPASEPRWQPGRPVDLHRYRVLFPDKWRAFLHAQFRRPEDVAVFFDVTDKTARNWWDGVGGVPLGHVTAVAVQEFPVAFNTYCRAA